MLVIFLISGIIALGLIANGSKDFLHILQLTGYDSEQYSKWVRENRKKVFSFKSSKQESKKPLVFTNRAKRLFGTFVIVNGAFIGLFIYKIEKMFKPTPSFILPMVLIIFFALYSLVLYFFRAVMMQLSNEFIRPIENRINIGFYKEAQRKIKSREDLTVVGVTGSFGKTSTKFILGTILSEKFSVLNTPESYNTPMGLSKVINNNLNESHEIFIAELGARNIGDIKEVAELVSPKIGIITSIGPTHLETFKNIDNIAKTKYELIEELPTDGIAIFNYDNEHIKKVADKTFKEKILYGIDDIEELDLYAKDIEVSEFGSSFTITDGEENSMRCSTKLLGKHNIYNILAGVAVAKSLGMTMEEIKEGIGKIEPIPHRLNIINPGTGIIIIDDAFNSNPIGARAALEVLSQFKEGRKIIVTPGMVELGAMEESANRELGENIGKVCDYAILIGANRTKPIYEGLMEVSYNEDNIFVVNSLEEATGIIQKIAKPKDIILFENDLPDNYSE